MVRDKIIIKINWIYFFFILQLEINISVKKDGINKIPIIAIQNFKSQLYFLK